MFVLNNKFHSVIETHVDLNTLKCAVTIGTFDTSQQEEPTSKSLCIVSFLTWDENSAASMELAVQSLSWIAYDKDLISSMLAPDIIVLPFNLATAQSTKIDQLNLAYNKANSATFVYLGIVYNADPIAQNNLNSTANYINQFHAFPPGFPDMWLSDDGSVLPLPTTADFWPLYQAYAAQGVYNITHFSTLKYQVTQATTQAELDAIIW